MEKRIGTVIILVESRESVSEINKVISEHSDIVIGRQGIPSYDRSRSIISLVFEGSTDQIGALTGKLGRLDGIKVKSAVVK